MVSHNIIVKTVGGNLGELDFRNVRRSFVEFGTVRPQADQSIGTGSEDGVI